MPHNLKNPIYCDELSHEIGKLPQL